MVVNVPDDWTPTAANVNALPAPLRRYVHDLETLCDPSGWVRENAILRDTVEAQHRIIEELRGR